jgi:hypothetical protein
MPEEIVAIIIISILAGTISGIIKQVLEYKKTRNLARSDSSGSSLTTSELVELLRESVEQATEPLYERMTRIEERLDRRPPASGTSGDLMQDVEGYGEADPETHALRKKSLGRTG